MRNMTGCFLSSSYAFARDSSTACAKNARRQRACARKAFPRKRGIFYTATSLTYGKRPKIERIFCAFFGKTLAMARKIEYDNQDIAFDARGGKRNVDGDDERRAA